MLKVFECFFGQCVLSTVQYLSRLDTFLQVQGQCHFLGKLLYCMTWPFTKHLQVLPKPRGGCSRSSRSSRPFAWARRGRFRWLCCDPGGCVASGSQRRLAQAAEPKWYPGGGRAKDSSGWRRQGPLLGDLIGRYCKSSIGPQNPWKIEDFSPSQIWFIPSKNVGFGCPWMISLVHLPPKI